jgi:hypothetical protein
MDRHKRHISLKTQPKLGGACPKDSTFMPFVESQMQNNAATLCFPLTHHVLPVDRK